jgi:hypothetical protein
MFTKSSKEIERFDFITQIDKMSFPIRAMRDNGLFLKKYEDRLSLINSELQLLKAEFIRDHP